MTLTEVLPAVQSLSLVEKEQLAALLVTELSNIEAARHYDPHAVYPI